ncbi:hypothetical protein FJ960_03475 [Mesorhizobium sp. B2-3-11]|uniref:hypothetical protein n=1 Tax=Mesorhizobium sp. B2-3-11 TaxID=2589953 RepID=UPI001129AFD9|nr:hypothetical protein [Mesorhizobium sp. B2-3-11]TPM09819.1 hypothetical protein FJ960_03475 [Mesorhizobium sp. B2-3-11]
MEYAQPEQKMPPTMMVDVTQLTEDGAESLFQTYEELVEIMRNAYNTLVSKLVACPSLPEAHAKIINDWSIFHTSFRAACRAAGEGCSEVPLMADGGLFAPKVTAN